MELRRNWVIEKAHQPGLVGQRQRPEPQAVRGEVFQQHGMWFVM
jgi:hypothetical protein